jgi:hypothetical protein
MIKKLKKISKQLKKSVSAHKKQATFLEKHAKSMKNKKVMKASKGEMALKDFVEEGVFEPGSRAYEKVMQDDVDQAAQRYDMIKGARKALKKIKLKKKMESGLGYARAVPGLGSLAGSVAGIAADMKSSMPTMGKEGSFKKGGMSKARGTGCAIRGTNFKGIF